MIIPCSGIGKPFGTISRDATFRVVDELRKGKADTNCLSLLVMGDEEATRQIRESRCIAVDGCPLACARKNIEIAGGTITAYFRVVDLLRARGAVSTDVETFQIGRLTIGAGELSQLDYALESYIAQVIGSPRLVLRNVAFQDGQCTLEGDIPKQVAFSP